MPTRVACSSCGASYSLKDQLRGKKVRCPQCNAVIEVPTADVERVLPDFVDDLAPAFRRDRFLLRQKHLAINEKYYVWDDEGNELLFIERPAHTLRNLAAMFAAIFIALALIGLTIVIGQITEQWEIVLGVGIPAALVLAIVAAIAISPRRHITFYADDRKTEPILEILQDRKVAVTNMTYTVRTPEGDPLGRYRKNYLYNFFRKTWFGSRPDGSDLLVAKEDSLILSLLRRFIGPLFGLLRTNFVIFKPDGQTVIGEFNRKLTLLDRYVLDLGADEERYLDRRLAVALGILLDTGERR